MKKIKIPQIIAFCLAMVMNSFSVVLINKSQMGVSTLSSIPTILSQIFPQLSFGMWNMGFQMSLMLLLVLLIHKKLHHALISMLISVVFGLFLDFFNHMIGLWPTDLAFRCGYFLIGFITISTGAYLFIQCNFPILPLDSFIRDLALYYQWPYAKTKTSIDILFVLITIILSLLAFHSIRSVGFGTILLALFMGWMIKTIGQWISQRVDFI